MLSREQIANILRAEVERAAKRHDAVTKNLRNIAAAPAEDLKAASTDLRRALARFNAFVLHGIIPEDLTTEQTNKAAG